ENASHAPTLLIFFFLVKRMAPSMSSIGKFQASIAKSTINVHSVLDILSSEKEKFVISNGSKKFAGLKDCFEFRDLNFSYNSSKKILNGLTCQIKRGKTTALIGGTGFGKTTIVNLLLRFYDVPAGSLFIDGVDIREFDYTSLHRKTALVSQDILLFHDTLRNNLTYEADRSVTDDEIWIVLKRLKLADMVLGLPKGLDTLTGDRGLQLSGGERQRIALARALLKNAEIYVFDEATSSLDTKTETEVQLELLSTVAGKTVLVVAHRLSVVRHVDHIIVVKDGKVAEEGSPDELLKRRDHFFQYWQTQIDSLT
ncbi:MAG TPA: ABC transporter ATP-binding protein, partial [Candidatus Omnitrophica bacterium]|nr:ABC transporter ATP-binding protein [Candidatus Omnitrophota bacterium]